MVLYPDPRKQPFDIAPYEDGAAPVEPFYGLPSDIRFCKRCVISNQRPNSTVEFQHKRDSKKETIAFVDGVCDACRLAERKGKEIDWEERRRELQALCDARRSRNGSYDCLVPGSGGKDSFYQAWVLKYEFGMNPLTVTWSPNMYTEWGWRNFVRWSRAGFDNYLLTPNGRVQRLLTRLAVETILHPFQPFILGQKSFGPAFAALKDIPLVFYGENEAEYGNPIADNSTAVRDYRYFADTGYENMYLGGVSVQSIIDDFGVSLGELKTFLPSDPTVLQTKGVEVQYLGYYLKWHPQSAYYHAVDNGGFEASPERTAGTYSKYNSIDDKIDDFHYYTTFIKFGIGRATYDAAQEIRSGDIEREEGVALVRRYDGEYPDRFDQEIFEYLSLPEKEFPVAARQFESSIMDRAYFEALCDRARSPHLWRFSDGEWRLRRRVFDEPAAGA